MRWIFYVMGRLGILLCLLVLMNCAGGDSDGGDGGDSNGSVSQFTGIIEPTISVRANFNGLAYPIKVCLPQAYVENPQQRFPVLSVLDAEWRFDPAVHMVDEKGKVVIVAGIGNGDGHMTGRRATDYRLPGARADYDFLITQVIPYIDAQYRTDSANRTLLGHSLGGLFTGLALSAGTA